MSTPASPYLRLKLLLAPPQKSASTTPITTSISYVIKKVEVPRTLPFLSLCRKLSLLYGIGSTNESVVNQIPFICHATLEQTSNNLVDEQLSRSETSRSWSWLNITDEKQWTELIQGKEKLLVRLTPIADSSVNSSSPSTSSSTTRPLTARSIVQPIVPKRAPAPWPKYSPDPSTLPLIIYSNDEHEWEILEEEEFERMELEAKNAPCKKSISTNSVTSPKKHEGKSIGKNAKILTKPNRVPPPELLAKLSSSVSSGTPTPVTVVTFSVNNQTFVCENPSPTLKLIEYLRYQVGITGQKIGCGEGGCGACTVVLSQTTSTGQVTTFSTNACLHPVAQLDGWAVMTTEGLGSEHVGLHPIQQSMVDNWGTQCGYCSPGMVMSMYGLLQNNSKPTAQEIEDRFDGNICRCTGYRPILKAMRAVVPGITEELEEKKSHEHNGSSCGTSGGCGSSSSVTGTLKPCGKGEGLDCSSGAKSACNARGICCGSKKDINTGCVDLEDIVKYDPTNPKHNINPFPHALVEYNYEKSRAKKANSLGIRYVADSVSIWYEPSTVADVFAILTQYSGSEVVKLVGGNTSIGVEKYYPLNPASDNPTIFVNMTDLPELKDVNVVPNDGIYVGSAIPINSLIEILTSTIASMPAASVASWLPLVRHMNMIANTGVRNVGTWAGNLMIAKNHPQFPSDLMTIFAAVGCSLTLTSGSTGQRTVDVTDFPTTTLGADEFIYQLHLPFTPANLVFDCYKVRARHQNSHPIINSAFNFMLSPSKQPDGNYMITSSNLIIGGLTGTGIFQAQQTMAYLNGKELSAATLTGAISVLNSEAIPGVRTDPNSTYYIEDPAYRQSLVLTTFYKFFLEQLSAAGVTLPPRDTSAFEWYQRPISGGAEVFTPDGTTAPVGQAIPKIESKIQVTGEAKYVDDLELPPNGLWGSFVYSKVALGTIASIDATVAMSMPGVFQFITAKDIAALPNGVNDCGSFPGDEPIFASTQVTATGQSVGMILADTRAHADAAAAAVVINFVTPLPKPIITTADAIAAKSFFPDNQYMQNPPPITCGNFASAYAAAPNKLEGTNTTGGQTHFSLETQTCFVLPQENDGLYVHSSSQGPTDIRGMVIRCTGLPAHKVTVSTRRCGGGFGGKLSRSHPIACATAIAARITNRPIKAQCDRVVESDMWGKRAEMYMTYQVGYDNTGKILALSVDFYQRGGHTYESNFGAMSMCLLWADNAYYIPNYSVTGFTCLTNTPSNTAMRGPGAMKSIWHMEMLMERIASSLNLAPEVVRATNFYTEGALTPYQQPVTNITIQRIWTTLQTQANYAAAQAAAATFNTNNKWRKRGVHMSAVKYGLSLPGNQIGMLLNVMQDDGTVVVSHTGCEIGQGINTKVAQTIALELGIDISLIIIDDNATNFVANGSQTGGSSTSESACAAAILACTELNTRLAPVVKAHPSLAWPALIAQAATFVNADNTMVNLTVQTQYAPAPPASNFPFTYFAWGAACTQVELDVLTGEVQVLQADIVYDAGDALNPAIDIGQIEGAFVIGLGHYLTETVAYDDTTGRLQTRGTFDYHPPSSQDIPLNLNVTLLSAAKNPVTGTILGSKATAEPPMMLSTSLFLAVRDCIAAVRADNGLTGWFDLATPASTQAVQLACGITPSSLVV